MCCNCLGWIYGRNELRDAQKTTQPIPQDSADGLPHGQAAEVAGSSYYVQWCRGDEIEQRIALGWSIAQHKPCHHNEYALLMRAPEGWEP